MKESVKPLAGRGSIFPAAVAEMSLH